MPLLIGSILVAALAGLLFGFDTAVIAGVTADLTRVMDLTPASLGVTVSSALWGTLLGALFAGVPGDRFGSRACLRVLALLYVISGLGCALAWDWPSLLIFRFIGGIGIGGSSVLAPVYITELSPPARRGALTGLFQLNIVAGILVAYLSNWLIGGIGLGAAEWRWKLAVTAVPALLFFALLWLIPASPRWLIAKGRIAEALAVLRRIGSKFRETDLTALRTAVPEGRAKLSWRHYKKPIALAITIGMFNQLSGINAILYYLNDIFAAAGFGKISADAQSVAVGATNFLFTALAMLVIDRIGRKTLLLIGSVGMAISLSGAAVILSGLANPSGLLWVLLGFIASFAFSQGAVIWVYISEIFPTPVRARGQSLGSGTHWLMNALISGLFPLVAAWSKGLPFLFFAAMMGVQFIVVLLFFPETKRLSLEDITSSAATGR
jgi:sugar porter (SP) family MFS transporter